MEDKIKEIKKLAQDLANNHDVKEINIDLSENIEGKYIAYVSVEI